MILHFAKENNFKVSRPAGPARSAQEEGRETLQTDRFTLVPPPPTVPSSCPPPGGRPWG